MRKIWFVALLSVTLVAASAMPAVAGDDLPFKAKADRVWATPMGPNPGCPEGYVGEDSLSIGTGTHLGRFELFETLCLDFRTPPIAPFEVHGEFVAANGDNLLFDVYGEFHLGTGEMTSSGLIFGGGTGRFESATGGAEEELIRDDTGIIGVTMEGTISYNASDRAG